MRHLLLIAFSLTATVLWSQQADPFEAVLIPNPDLLPSDFENFTNTVTVTQVGNDNDVEILIDQQRSEPNQTRVRQQGNRNLVEIDQAGGSNQVILLQNGSDNTYSLDMSGTDNELSIIQDGNYNTINQRLLNSSALDIEFIQQGDGNLIEHQTDGLLSKDIKVTQSGNDMQVIVTQSVVLPPSGN